jgi:hypothetical protein
MKSTRIVGSTIGLLLGAAEVSLGFILRPDPSNWIAALIGYSNILPGLLTLAYHNLFHPGEAFLRGVFYFFIIAQWAFVGFLVGWFFEHRAGRRRVPVENGAKVE